jgi:hypothetical protein
MLRYIVQTLAVLAIGGLAAAEPWLASLDASLMATQNAYSNSWTGGEAGALSWATNWNFAAQRQFNARWHGKNTLKLSFGQTLSQEQESKRWMRPVKSTDLIDAESVWRLTLGFFVDPFAAVRLESQFLDASQPDNIRYGNPLKFTESFGAARSFFKEKDRELTVRLGAAFRQLGNRGIRVVTVDSLGNILSSTIDMNTNDGGLEFVTDYKTPLGSDKITYTSKLTVYKAVFNSKKDELAGLPNQDYWKQPDAGWENTLNANISKYLMVNLYLQMLYDKEVDLRARFKQTLSLGLTYSLK